MSITTRRTATTARAAIRGEANTQALAASRPQSYNYFGFYGFLDFDLAVALLAFAFFAATAGAFLDGLL